MRLRCTNCEASFEGEKTERCPKCLRRTSVIEAASEPLRTRAEGPAPWPAGTTCSLCLVRPVTSATFHLEIAKPGSGDEGGLHEWTSVRCRCCDACRERVAALPRLRWSALPFVAIGTLAWIFALLSDFPQRRWGIGKLEAGMLSTLVCALVVGVPLVLVDRAQHRVRKCFETSWLLTRLQHGLGHEGGAVDHALWKLDAEAPKGAEVRDATDILRS